MTRETVRVHHFWEWGAMTAETTFDRELAFVFGAAGGAVARVLRQPLIRGYVMGGILIGPSTPTPVLGDVHPV